MEKFNNREIFYNLTPSNSSPLKTLINTYLKIFSLPYRADHYYRRH